MLARWLLLLLLAAAPAAALVLEDFESGAVELTGYPDQDHDPDGWSLVDENTYDHSGWSLRLTGNTWKIEAIAAVALVDSSVWQVAVHCGDRAEMHGFGLGDGQNELFYTFFGEDLPASTNWWTVYQGAFPLDEWRLYLLPVGRDWQTTFGYLPTIDRLVYVNDGDDGPAGEVTFDAIADVTLEQPEPPRCRILYTIESQRKVARDLFEVAVQFHGKAFDPEGGALSFQWDFGDSTGSGATDPAHEFLVHADYPYTVSLAVTDPGGLAAGDTCQIQVQPGGGEGPLTVNFVGDIMTGRGYEYNGGIIETQGIEALFAPTLPIFGQAADVSVANLEVSYTTRGTPHPTKSVVFRSWPENLDGVAFAGVDVVSIGNNHIIDYGEIGMLDTIDGLEQRSIRYCGAGVNEYFAILPCFWTERGVRLAFLGQCNRTGRQWNYQPFLDAGHDKPGFGYLLPHNLEAAIGDTRGLADVVIVQTHSGDEYQTQPPDDGRAWLAPPPIEANEPVAGAPEFRFRNEPTPGERELRRLGLELGADVLINHHPHVLQGFESYQGKLIAHSLGNFVFDLWYPETMPTMVLSLEIAKDGVVGQTFTPAWIDHWIPRPATGQLGREIVDRLADYSRPMNAIVVPEVGSPGARIHLSRAEVDSQTVPIETTTALEARDGWSISAPLRLDADDGYLCSIDAVTGDGAGWQVRWGREILWHGNFEDEGADLWDVNTAEEWLDDSVAHGGTRSLAHRRASGGGNPVGTDLERHLPCDPTREHSAVAWLLAENAADARVMLRFYENRSTETVLVSHDLADAITGDAGWTRLWRDVATPAGANYFELRSNLGAPVAGTASAWFDDLAMVEWEPWQDASSAPIIPTPHNHRFLQVRTASPGATTATVAAAGRIFGGVLTARPDVAAAPATLALSNYPNPFNPRTTLALDLPPSGRPVDVTIEIYDVRGRRIADLFRGRLAAGRRHGITWDGQDDAGRAVASGTYVARASIGGEVATRKLLLVR